MAQKTLTMETTMSRSQSISVSQSKRGTSLTESFTELFDFRFLIYQSILHPLEAVKTYLPHLSVCWSASKIFTPDQDIPDLQDRVILVTGGAPQPRPHFFSAEHV